MNGFAFRIGTTFDLSGATHRIERLGPDEQVVLERLHDGQIVMSSRPALLDAYRTLQIEVCEESKTARPQTYYGRTLAELPTRVRKEIERRMAYLQAIEDDGNCVFTAYSLQPLIDEVSARISDPKPPSVITLYRWHRRYQQSRQVRNLVPRYDLRGGSQVRQHARCLELAAEATKEAFDASPAATVRNIYDRLLGKLQAENQQRLPSDQIPAPALRTMYRLMDRMEAYDLAMLRNGKAAADRRFRIVKAGPKVTRILERVEADHTPLDLFLIDQVTGLPLGRPLLTVYIDVFSRFPLGYHLSFGNTSAAAVIGGLRHAVLPKAATVEVIPNLPVQHVWPCYGLMDVLVLDNGLEFLGEDLNSVAYDLGTRLQFCPKRQPRFKGVVERYLKTVNYFFTHQLPGTSLARLSDRGDYDAAKHAVLSLAEFRHLFEKWLLDVYAQTVQRGIGTTPWARWHEGLNQRTPILPGSVAELQRRIGLVRERSLGHQGIQLHGLHYAGPALSPVIRTWGPGTKVRVVFDADDLGSIHVWPPEAQEPITVEAIHLNYAKGLSLYQHELIREQVRINGKSSENLEALIEAKHQLAQAVDEMIRSRKQRTRRQAAHIHGMSSRQPEARFEASAPKAASPTPRPTRKATSGSAPALPPTPFSSFTLMRGKEVV